ncbi:uncharacterized protein LOC122253693, partial [Penaeus japonicus]|uniref:uncharacterized protein LOC122253693 n=1 Tax=Penaeus japonicus TaxID=27405 RepID=UPI001C70C9A9
MASPALSLLVAVVALTSSSALLPRDVTEQQQQKGVSKYSQPHHDGHPAHATAHDGHPAHATAHDGHPAHATAPDVLQESPEDDEGDGSIIASPFVWDEEEKKEENWPNFYQKNREEKGNIYKGKDGAGNPGNKKNRKLGMRKKMKKEKGKAKLLPTTSLRKIYWDSEPLKRTWEVEKSVDPAGVSCRDDEWACVDGSMCVPKNVTCSGVAECQDGSDEAVALCGCLPNEYNCGHQCIDALSRCDTVRDCDNGRDEQNCETYVCPSSHTKCANSLCIPLDAVCNLVDDCGDASDEQEC